MKIKITKITRYRADLVDLPGSPPCGDGDTPERAIANLFLFILRLRGQENWLRHIDLEDCILEQVEE